MTQITRLQCCGILELYGLHDFLVKDHGKKFIIDNLIKCLFTYLTSNQDLTDYIQDKWRSIKLRPYIVLSYNAVTYVKEGETFIDWIKENNMGECVVTKSHKNPNSGNNLIFILWMPNSNNLLQYFYNTWIKPIEKEIEEKQVNSDKTLSVNASKTLTADTYRNL
jgi:hypothetical protein